MVSLGHLPIDADWPTEDVEYLGVKLPAFNPLLEGDGMLKLNSYKEFPIDTFHPTVEGFGWALKEEGKWQGVVMFKGDDMNLVVKIKGEYYAPAYDFEVVNVKILMAKYSKLGRVLE